MSNTTTIRNNAKTIRYPPQQLLEHNSGIQPLTQGISPPVPPLSQYEIQQRLKEIHNNVERIRIQTEKIKGGGRRRTTRHKHRKHKRTHKSKRRYRR